MIRVTCLLLGSGVVSYCWKITSLELRVSFQMRLSLELQPSAMENTPQDHEWSSLLTLATKLLTNLHIMPTWPMARGYHNRLALRMDRCLENATYPPRTYSPTQRDCLFTVSINIAAGHAPGADYHHWQAFRRTNSEGVINLGTRFFVTSRLSDPLNHFQEASVPPTPPNSPTSSHSSLGFHDLSEI